MSDQPSPQQRSEEYTAVYKGSPPPIDDQHKEPIIDTKIGPRKKRYEDRLEG